MAVYGLYYALTQPVLKALVVDTVGESVRGRALGIYFFVTSIATLAASLITGQLWKHYGAGIPFYFSAAAALVAAGMLQFSRRSASPNPLLEKTKFTSGAEALTNARLYCRLEKLRHQKVLCHPLASLGKSIPAQTTKVLSRLRRLFSHRKINNWAAMPAQVSRTTSCQRPVRDGIKVWCHSSRLATNAVINIAIADHRTVHKGFPEAGKVSRQARNARMLRMA